MPMKLFSRSPEQRLALSQSATPTTCGTINFSSPKKKSNKTYGIWEPLQLGLLNLQLAEQRVFCALWVPDARPTLSALLVALWGGKKQKPGQAPKSEVKSHTKGSVNQNRGQNQVDNISYLQVPKSPHCSSRPRTAFSYHQKENQRWCRQCTFNLLWLAEITRSLAERNLKEKK